MTAKTGDRRAWIVAAAGRIVAREGAAAVTTRKIAGEAGVNLAALHSLFGSKDALLAAVLDQATGLLIAALARPVRVPTGIQTALTETVTVLWSLADREPWLPLVRCELLLYLRQRPAYEQEARDAQRRYLSALAGRCHGARTTTGGSVACGLLAGLVASTVDGLALQSVFLDSLRARNRLRKQALLAIMALAEGDAPPRGRTDGTGKRTKGDAVRRRRSPTRGAPPPVADSG